MKKKPRRMPAGKPQAGARVIRFCTTAAIAMAALLGYGFYRSQEDGPEKMWQAMLKVAAAGWAAVYSWAMGLDNPIKALIVMMAVDYTVGLILAACGKSKKTASGKLSSRVSYRGLAKKMAMLGIVALGALIDMAVGSLHIVRDAFTIFYCVNEFISIMEHAKKLNVAVPPVNKILGKVLDQGMIAAAGQETEADNKSNIEGTGIG